MLWFLYVAHFCNVIYLWSFKLLASILWKLCPWQKSKLKFTKGNNSKNSWNRDMVLVHCTSPNVTYLCMKFEAYEYFWSYSDISINIKLFWKRMYCNFSVSLHYYQCLQDLKVPANDKILDCSTSADEKNKCDWKFVIYFGTGREHFGKRRNCCLRAFFHFPTMLSKGFFFNFV